MLFLLVTNCMCRNIRTLTSHNKCFISDLIALTIQVQAQVTSYLYRRLAHLAVRRPRWRPCLCSIWTQKVELSTER